MIPSLQQGQLGRRRIGGAYSSDTVFLLDVSGASPADKSGYTTTFTPSANAPLCSTDQSKWSGRSLKVTGINCSTLADNSGLFNVAATTAYTLEAWVYISSATGFAVSQIGLDGPSSSYVEYGYSGSSRWLWANTGSFGDQFNGFFSGSVAIPSATWTHIAIVRPAGSAQIPRVYSGGSYRGTFDTAHNFNNGGQSSVAMGWFRDTTNSQGTSYIEDLRLTLNQELYTGTGGYTVPSAPF